MAKKNPKKEDYTIRVKFDYDGRKIGDDMKECIEDTKDLFIDELIHALDNIQDKMQEDLDDNFAPVQVICSVV